jgi:hypothetical protein
MKNEHVNIESSMNGNKSNSISEPKIQHSM